MSAGPPGPPDKAGFDALYATTPAWDIGRPQPALLALAEAGALRGRVLDVGCGTGEHALMAAAAACPTTGVDSAPTAIGLAEAKARQRGVEVRFVVWDALELPGLGEQFDTVLDSGLFHVFSDDDRARYVESLRAVVSAGGSWFGLCFSDRVPGAFGPRRIAQDEIRAAFSLGWSVVSITESRMVTTFIPTGVSAWLAEVRRD